MTASSFADPNEIRSLADAVDRYAIENGQDEVIAEFTEGMREKANELAAQLATRRRKFVRLSAYVQMVASAQGGEKASPELADQIASLLLDVFDIEFKDKSGPSLGEDFDPDDYK